MTNKSSCARSLFYWVIFWFSVSGGATSPPVAQSTDNIVKKFLPPGATVETLRTSGSRAKEARTSAAKFGWIRTGAMRYLAFVYREDEKAGRQFHLKLRIVENPEGQPVVLEKDLPGTFLWTQDFKTNGFQLLDLNGDGDDEIVTITSEGASLGAYLNIFSIQHEKIKSLLTVDGYRIRFDRDARGVYRIIIYGKWTEKGNSSIDIYEWDGERFVPSRRDALQYYDEEIETIVQKIYSREAEPASWRVMLTKQVVGLYILQQRYSEAIQLCEDVLRVIDDPNLTVAPNSAIEQGATPEERGRIQAWWEVNKIKGKAAIYRLLGDTYRAAGEAQLARREYTRAKAIEAEAKLAESKLPH